MEYPEHFKEFWKLWPGRWRPDLEIATKVGKFEAFKVWKKIPQNERDEIMSALRSGRVKRAGTQYLPDAHRWLSKRGWDDFS